MTTQAQATTDTEVLIRFSHAWWIYMFARGGVLRALVNGLEDTLAITGRTLLLIFLLYCGVKSGALLVKPDWNPPIWLEMGMFVLQLAGLEGSIPGLARYADTLREKNDQMGAKKITQEMWNARIMTILTIGEGVLHLFGIPIEILRIISGLLLLVRGVVITSFLIELAKIDAKGPRVLSRNEFEREAEARQVEGEQAQTIAALQARLSEAVAALTTTQQQAKQSESEHLQMIARLRDQVSQLEQTQASLLTGAEGQDETIRNLQNQVAYAEQQLRDSENVSADLQTARLQINDLQTALTASAHLQQEYQNVSAHLQAANAQIADLTSKLERAKYKIADLQHPTGEAGKPARATHIQPTQAQKITSIDEARAKHVGGTGGQGKTKMSHAEVIAFMESHAGLKRIEIAEQLGISERKVYDALTWQREQEQEKDDVATTH